MVTLRQSGRVGVQVVCVAEGRGFVKDMLVPVGQTVGWCVNASGVAAIHEGFRGAKIGGWGRVVKVEAVVGEGDRNEVHVRCAPETLICLRHRLKPAALG